MRYELSCLVRQAAFCHSRTQWSSFLGGSSLRREVMQGCPLRFVVPPVAPAARSETFAPALGLVVVRSPSAHVFSRLSRQSRPSQGEGKRSCSSRAPRIPREGPYTSMRRTTACYQQTPQRSEASSAEDQHIRDALSLHTGRACADLRAGVQKKNTITMYNGSISSVWRSTAVRQASEGRRRATERTKTAASYRSRGIPHFFRFSQSDFRVIPSMSAICCSLCCF